jgi:LytS/YehU family sensor histidine kinase
VAVAVIVLLVVLLMRYIAIRGQLRKEKSENLNRNLLNLKLKALRAQMNPHFTFNVMNSIQHFILHRNEESAHRYLSKFSKLMRAILNNSEKDTVSIAEEIKALELYLELESMRFEQGFSYAIVIDRNIDVQRVHIPSMLIQPFVENALIHGILPSQKKGKLTVEIRLEDNRLLCIIEDNGVGRAKAMEKKKAGHKSFGTSITKERLSTINALHNSTLSEKTIDLYDASGQATGTRVEIYIPLMKPYEDESDHY